MFNKRGTFYLAASILALTCTLPSPVLSEDAPEAYFYPAKKWVVERVKSAASSSLPTCMLFNQFNNGFIVQFAGNRDGFTNINLDVRKPTFEENKRYEVEYSVPGISQDIIPTKAFKDNLLVSDLRKKDEFTSALRMASVIDVKIQGNGFRLYLTGLDAAMKDYAECITPAKERIGKVNPTTKENHTIDDTEVATGVIQITPPSDVSLETEKEDKNAQTEEKQNVSTLIIKPHKTDDLKAEAIEQESIKEERYTETLAREMEDYNEIFEPEPDYNPAPEVKTKEIKIINIDDTDTVDVQSKIEQPSTSRIVIPTQKPTSIVAPSPSASELAAVNTPQPEQLLSTEPSKIHNSLRVEKPEIPVQNIPTLAAIEPSAPGPAKNSEDFVNMRNKIAELEEQLSTLINEKEMLNEELKLTLQESEEERLSISSNNWNLERATMRYNEAERQIDRLGRQLKNSRQQCDMEKTELEKLLFDPQLTEQKQISKLSTLEAELDDAKTEFSIKKRQYEERIRVLEEQLDKL
ncbi:MAG: hypothetical protein OEY94_09930 [Alphaproteobacteria bacterium]|nr:hypothetical protein [Alphaproteobacteria bacterium]